MPCIDAVTQVIQYMNSGMTVVEACREVGMPLGSFYYVELISKLLLIFRLS
jgi:hypothetical protein